ncbi:hypothetical protein FACS1894166_04180 [Bacilli bacterium]|nr:hypothetical protein FACS1894166_04180 [Bacilli bacterium]
MKKTQLIKKMLIPACAVGLVGIAVGTVVVATSCSKLKMKNILAAYDLTEEDGVVTGELSSSKYAVVGLTTKDDKKPKGDATEEQIVGTNKGFGIFFASFSGTEDETVPASNRVAGYVTYTGDSLQAGQAIKDVSV